MGTESSQKSKGKGHFATSCPNRNKETNDQSNLAQDGGPVLNMMTVARSKEDVVFLKEGRVDPKQYASTPCDKNTWILDNGESNHMTGNPEWFSNIDRNKTSKVSFGDGSCVEIKGRGTIVVEGQMGEQRALNDVYFIPSLKNSIISLGQLDEGGCKIGIQDGILWIFEQDGRLLIKVPRSFNRVCKINLKVVSPVCLQVSLHNVAWIWHARLGRLNFDALRGLSKLADGVPRI
ncbi:uncharacterized protein LOC143555880 [Bidens hawaiensis]|uniref:uncharacterized protein LOC143555880 n=1 Tax=Bidens hawaiensis TaxID=980011 RepID=UPI00404AF3B1